MLWFVRDFDLLGLLLRAVSFALEALAFGSLFFLLFAARPARLAADTQARLRRIASWFALALAVTQVVLLATTSAELMGTAGLGFREVVTAAFFISGCIFTAAALVLFVLLRATARLWPAVVAAFVALSASVSLSHAASRMDHRSLLLMLTAGHHLGMAAWLGALPFLLIAINFAGDDAVNRAMARRFSTMAVAAAATLVLAGAGLAWFYAGSWHGMYGTAYGILLSAKIVLTALTLTLGAANFVSLRETDGQRRPLLFRLRRFSEVELGLGFTVLIAAASLTAQSPSVDESPENILSAHGVVQRMEWRWPGFHTPALAQLAPPTPLSVAVPEATFTGGSASDANDRAWSEYNHHWAGLIVFAAGLLALVARLPGQRWAQHWPLLFLGLAVFIVLRADPECWPLGPRPFWASFTAPDVLEHRLFAALAAAFALFEWGVRTGRLRWPRARFVFPALCAAGGALLLTHTHALGEGTDEVFAELSHTPMAVLGAAAGWSRWLELRLDPGLDPGPGTGDASAENARPRRIAAWIWPVCLVLVGLLLLNYRES
ncbi:MAG TPA: CopD family protein [Acidobacteriaceae bacterium]|nr:CopD family protein [Acidobacteriaceae bacterium]